MKGMLTPEVKLIDATNSSGETALLRAVPTGCMAVINALLDEGSDVCHVNTSGHNVLHLCAKECQIWTLHFLYSHILTARGTSTATQMLHAIDNSGNGLLELAAEAGDVNLTEYLLRKGLNPYRAHPDTGTTPLHIAVSRHRLELSRFLLSCGCNPHAKDTKGVTPLQVSLTSEMWLSMHPLTMCRLQHHALKQDPVLREGVAKHPKMSKCTLLRCGSTDKEDFPPLIPSKVSACLSTVHCLLATVTCGGLCRAHSAAVLGNLTLIVLLSYCL